MKPVYAAALSFSQGRADISASSSLSETTAETQVALHVDWSDLPAVKPGHSPTEWLYCVLARLVENFDDHVVTYKHVSGLELMEEGMEDA